MQVIGHKPSDQKSSSAINYEAGLRDSFAPCHDPIPTHMREMLARLDEIDERRMAVKRL